MSESILEICTTQVADSGQYSCSIGNEVSNTSAGFEVSVIAGGGEHCITNILTIYGPEVIVQELSTFPSHKYLRHATRHSTETRYTIMPTNSLAVYLQGYYQSLQLHHTQVD